MLCIRLAALLINAALLLSQVLIVSSQTINATSPSTYPNQFSTALSATSASVTIPIVPVALGNCQCDQTSSSIIPAPLFTIGTENVNIESCDIECCCDVDCSDLVEANIFSGGGRLGGGYCRYEVELHMITLHP